MPLSADANVMKMVEVVVVLKRTVLNVVTVYKRKEKLPP